MTQVSFDCRSATFTEIQSLSRMFGTLVAFLGELHFTAPCQSSITSHFVHAEAKCYFVSHGLNKAHSQNVTNL